MKTTTTRQANIDSMLLKLQWWIENFDLEYRKALNPIK